MRLGRLAMAVALFVGTSGGLDPADAETTVLTVAVAPVNFGVYDPADPRGLTSTGFVEVGSSGEPYRVLLSSGAGGDFRSRKLLGKRELAYNLFADAGMRQVWGDGSNGTVAASTGARGTGVGERLIIYGFLPPGQRVPSGVYSDTIVVTIEF